MSDKEVSEYNIGVGTGNLLSMCKRCGQPMTGGFDSDNDSFELECVSCGFKAKFKTTDLFVLECEAIYEG